uniref:Putative trypsin-like peptidase domain containing protein n=1 Tax=viral metagenome TaxID=1070528 RepID=A0A6M3LHV5_9ZZZZ
MKKNKKRAYHCLAPESGRIFRLLHLHHTSHKEPFAGFLRVVTFVFLVIVGLVVAVGSYGIGYNFHRITHPITYGVVDPVAATIPAVVHIRALDGQWQGSGVLVSEDGLVLTARHVVEDNLSFLVTLNDGRKIRTDRAVYSKKYDVGFVKLPDGKYPFLSKITDKLQLGEAVFAIGSPFGEENFNSVTMGIISALQRDLGETPWGWRVTFQSDVTANPGNSGGPVFNMKGQLVGIVVAGVGRSYSGILYCIPSRLMMGRLDEIKLLFALKEFEEVTIKDEYFDYEEN